MSKISGGDVAKAVLERVAKNLALASSVRVGFLEGALYPDGISVPMVAAINEFGGSGPPRPYFRRMIKDKSNGWPAGLAAQLKATNYDARKSLEILGAVVKGQLQESINTLQDPPLAASTIRKKGHSKPLIDTSTMLNSVDYEVKE